MILWRNEQMGQAFARSYIFLEAGDALPKHEHAPDEEHNVVVTQGEVYVEDETGKCEFIPAGRIYNFDSSKSHRIVATKDHTRTLHVYLSGRPHWYDSVPQSGSFPAAATDDCPGTEG